jgi:hypothetical protein
LNNREERLTMGRVVSKYHYKSRGLSSFKKKELRKTATGSLDDTDFKRGLHRFPDYFRAPKKLFDFFE